MEEVFIGKHELRFEAEDVLVMRLRGPLLPGQMKEIADAHDARLLQCGRLFVLCDIGKAEPPSFASRQELRERTTKLPMHWVAYVGIPKQFATILDLMVRAISVLTSSKIVHRYFLDEPTARRWLVEMKRSLSA